jgi:purine-binding chemotaxis protein CheW
MTSDEDLHLLVFVLDGRRVALLASGVEGLIPAVAIARLPKAPDIVEGVINVRGTLVPVLDLRRRFGFAAAPLALDQHFILARAGPRLVALRVDRALDLTNVPRTAVADAARVVPGVEHVAGIAKLDDGLLVIHDLERFLSVEEARRLDAAMTDPEPTRGQPGGA